MFMSYRLRSFILILFALSVALLGGQPTFAQPTPPPTATPIPITFSIWHSWQNKEADLLADWVRAYQEANPYVTVETRFVDGVSLLPEVLDAIKRDQGPDVFIGSSAWAYQLAVDRRIAPLSERIDKDFRAQIMDKAWNTVKVGEFVYGIPESLNTVTLFYNSDLASVDKVPKNFDELVAANADMMFDFGTTSGVYFGLGGTLVNTNGEIVLEKEAAILQNYLQLVQGAYNKLKAANTLFTRDRIPVSTDRRFRDGKTAFLVDGSWKAEDLFTEMKDRVKIAPLPQLSNGKLWTPLLNSQVFYLNVNANQSDGALRFLKYVTGVEGQKRAAQVVGRIPVNPKAEPGRYTQALWQEVDRAVVLTPAAPETLTRLWGALDQAVFNVTVKGMDINTASQEAIATIRQKK
jgi:arabinogalactan oligomer/maltooligosaccharide transport system substrate-binding protein